MWNNLLKITLVSYIWKRYRRTLIALPLLLLYFWFVNLVHHDIIAYATLNDDTAWLGWSFLLKWLFILLGVTFFVFVHISAKPVDEDLLNPSFKKSLKESLKEKFRTEKITESEAFISSDVEDIFERIRNKKSLRSKADVVLEKNKK